MDTTPLHFPVHALWWGFGDFEWMCAWHGHQIACRIILCLLTLQPALPEHSVKPNHCTARTNCAPGHCVVPSLGALGAGQSPCWGRARGSGCNLILSQRIPAKLLEIWLTPCSSCSAVFLPFIFWCFFMLMLERLIWGSFCSVCAWVLWLIAQARLTVCVNSVIPQQWKNSPG